MNQLKTNGCVCLPRSYQRPSARPLTRRRTGIHWHGIRQLNNNINDGSPGVTECPIAPGTNKTYTFTATQYGTSWYVTFVRCPSPAWWSLSHSLDRYHTHVSSQYAYGVTGSIHIDGPASLPYDIDLGPFPISDWYYGSADQLLARVSDTKNPFVPGQPGASPPSDNILFNGTNVNANGTGGAYAKVALTPGKRHRLRLINPSVDNTFTVSIVGHQMTVIETDFVPVQAYSANSLYMGVGQRYDVTIDANEKPGNYWINVTFSDTKACGQSHNTNPAAILHYVGAPDALPSDPGTKPADTFCADETGFVPIVSRNAPLSQFSPETDTLSVSQFNDNKLSKVFWKVNGTAIDISWEKPTLEYVLERNNSFPQQENIIQIAEKSEVSSTVAFHADPRELSMTMMR